MCIDLISGYLNMKLADKQYDVIFKTDIATIGLLFQGSKLTHVDYLDNKRMIAAASKLAERVKNNIEKYLKPKSKVKSIKVDLQLQVTPFQHKVLTELQKIPYGETRTYGDIAKKLKTSARAVGNACRNNPLPIVIPCHRVVAANGIGGYDGATEGEVLDIKVALLRLEGVI